MTWTRGKHGMWATEGIHADEGEHVYSRAYSALDDSLASSESVVSDLLTLAPNPLSLRIRFFENCPKLLFVVIIADEYKHPASTRRKLSNSPDVVAKIQNTRKLWNILTGSRPDNTNEILQDFSGAPNLPRIWLWHSLGILWVVEVETTH